MIETQTMRDAAAAVVPDEPEARMAEMRISSTMSCAIARFE